MSLSHLNFSARSDAMPEADQEEVQIKRQIHESHYKEFFDETKFRNPDDVAKVPGRIFCCFFDKKRVGTKTA